MRLKCPYLWMHQCIGTTATVHPCCVTYNNDPQWRTITFEQGITSPVHRKSRQEFTKGKFPLICKVCKDDESNNIISHRQRAIKDFPGCDYKEIKIKYLDMKFTNTCNLSCRMCIPSSSSQLEKLYSSVETFDMPHHIQRSNPHFKSNAQAEKKVQHTKKLISEGLEILKVTGGEPFACKYFLEVVDWCIDNDYAKNLEIKFTTNATKVNKKLLDKIKKFKKTTITVSIDGVEKIYNYIRHQADWKTFDKNIDLLNSYEEFTPLNISFCLQFYNMLDVANYANWCKSKDIEPYVDVHMKPFDSELDVKFAPKKMKLKLLQDAEEHGLENVSTYVKKFIEVKDIEKQKSLKRTTDIVDKLHNTDYKTSLYPEQVMFLSGAELSA